MFPIIQIGMAFAADTLRSDAARSPPLSSSMGIMEIINMTISLDICWDRLSVNHCTKTSINQNYSLFLR